MVAVNTSGGIVRSYDSPQGATSREDMRCLQPFLFMEEEMAARLAFGQVLFREVSAVENTGYSEKNTSRRHVKLASASQPSSRAKYNSGLTVKYTQSSCIWLR